MEKVIKLEDENDIKLNQSFLDAKKQVNDALCDNFNIPLENVMESFNNLLSKELITLNQEKDKDGKLRDNISLDNLYNKIIKELNNEDKKNDEKSIFDIIEEEFERKLTPIDMEIINGWLEIGTSKDLIIGALKEASYNGVKTLKFMDQKIYDWSKKGFKNMDDVNKHLQNKEKTNQEEMFEYDWLNDDE